MTESRRYNTQHYQQLIDDYMNNGSTEIGNFILTGDEIMDFVEVLEKNNYFEEYQKTKETSQKLIKNIERIFKGKKGSIIDELRVLLDNAKEEIKE